MELIKTVNLETIINKATLQELDTLMQWRMEVLHHVFAIPEDADMASLEIANRKYYEKQLPIGGHIACLVRQCGEIVGCGGICIYNEMPSPDNPSGQCAYLMNIYCREAYRHQKVGRKIVSRLIEQADRLGITKIYLETSKDGKRLYTSMNFEDMADMIKLIRK